MAANASLAGLLAFVLTACGGGGSTVLIGGSVAPGNFLISGKVSGLTAGEQVVIMNNGADPTTISSSGVFTFTTPVVRDGTYSITVASQPAGETCTVSGATGAGVTANVATVAVTCSNSELTIGGTVSGLAEGESFTLLNNGANPTVVAANGAFRFATPVAYDSSYSITVGTAPTGQMCSVSGGSGAGVTASISNVTVACSTRTYSIGGTVSGLTADEQVTLFNNEANATTITANGSFTFSTGVALDGSYAVTVGTQPLGEMCTVTGGSGAGVTANVAAVSVACSVDTFSIGGTVSGLGEDLQVTLLNNGANATTVTANGAFQFSTSVAYGSSYAITVGTQPTGQTCTVTGGTGSSVTANITATVTCSASTFSVSGSVTGLGGGLQVTLLNNAANSTTLTASGAFTFSTKVAYGTNYAVTVGTQPVGQTCTVTGGSGNDVTANVTGVSVACVDNYTVSGTITGTGFAMDAGSYVNLYNNGTFVQSYNADGSYTFVTVASGGSYALTLGPPLYPGHYGVNVGCSASGATAGSNVTANVTGIAIVCVPY
jgi:hypothetical protein